MKFSFIFGILLVVSQQYIPYGYGQQRNYQIRSQPVFLSKPQAVPMSVYQSLETNGNFNGAFAVGGMEMPGFGEMYEDYPFGFPGAHRGTIDMYHPLQGGPNSMLNPAAFDDANLDDYLGSDFEGFMTGWGNYHRLHPHSKGPPPVYRPAGQRIQPPGSSPGNFNPHDFLNPISNGMGTGYPGFGMAPVAQGTVDTFGPRPAPRSNPSSLPPAGDGGMNAGNDGSLGAAVTLVFRNSFCTENSNYLDKVLDPFQCAEKTLADPNCGVYFFMSNQGGDCTCILANQPCKVEASDIDNNVYMVKSNSGAA